MMDMVAMVMVGLLMVKPTYELAIYHDIETPALGFH
jgi:hypothetical protein